MSAQLCELFRRAGCSIYFVRLFLLYHVLYIEDDNNNNNEFTKQNNSGVSGNCMAAELRTKSQLKILI